MSDPMTDTTRSEAGELAEWHERQADEDKAWFDEVQGRSDMEPRHKKEVMIEASRRMTFHNKAAKFLRSQSASVQAEPVSKMAYRSDAREPVEIVTIEKAEYDRLKATAIPAPGQVSADAVEAGARAIFNTWATMEGSEMLWDEAVRAADNPELYPRMARIVPMCRAEAKACLQAARMPAPVPNWTQMARAMQRIGVCGTEDEIESILCAAASPRATGETGNG